MKHTELPWQRNIPPAVKYPVVFSGRNKHVLSLKTLVMDEEEVEANMNFILTACNNHYELLEALKEAVSYMEDYIYTPAKNRATKLNELREIIAKVES